MSGAPLSTGGNAGFSSEHAILLCQRMLTYGTLLGNPTLSRLFLQLPGHVLMSLGMRSRGPECSRFGRPDRSSFPKPRADALFQTLNTPVQHTMYHHSAAARKTTGHRARNWLVNQPRLSLTSTKSCYT